MSEQDRILDDELFDIPLANIGVETIQAEALKEKGFTTIGEIYDLQAEGIAVALDIDFFVAESIWDRVLRIVTNPDTWFTSTISEPIINIPEILIPTIETFFADSDKHRLYTILVRRFGLNNHDKSTLDDIGIYFEITRERVRQLEAKGLSSLYDFFFKEHKLTQTSLFEDQGDNSNIDQVKAEVRTIKQLFEDEVEPYRSEPEMFAVIEARYSVTLTENQMAYLRLMFNVYGWKRQDNSSSIPIRVLPFWVISKDFKAKTLIDATTRIIKVLQDIGTRTSYWKLKVSLNRRLKNRYSDLIIRSAIKISPDIEALSDDYFQVAFYRLRSAPDQAFRILSEAGESLPARKIYRELSRRLAIEGEDIPVRGTVTNGMSADKRFIAIGKSEWALAEWDDIVQATILDLMIEFFHRQNQPASADEIYEYVNSKRHVNKSSINWYLGDSKEFVSSGCGLYQLSQWLERGDELGKTNERWSTKQIAELLVSIFDKHDSEILPVNILVSEIRQFKGDSSSSNIYTILRNSPAVKLSVLSERPRRLEAQVVRNYDLNFQPTQQELIESAIRTILSKQPEQTMRLVDLRDTISRRWNIHPQNVYGYVSKMIDVQKNIVEGSRTALVTLITDNQGARDIPDIWDSNFVYDVAISYASSNRTQAAELAGRLRSLGLKVFFDRKQLPDLIGQNLLDQLWTIYQNKARLCIILGSESYNQSDYAQHERKAAQDRAFFDPIKDPGYIVLVKVEDVTIDYFPSTFQYLDWKEYGAEKIAHFSKNHLDIRIQKINEKNLPMVTTHMNNTIDQIRILFLAANPSSTTKLRLDEEIREIDEYLRSTKFSNKFDIKHGWATRHRDLSRLLQIHDPHIVHFSGHGDLSGEIIVEDDYANAHPISPDQLHRLFKVLKDNVKCVVLNACWSVTQADAIIQEIDCVIGMQESIGDKAAINFARGFYQALGNGRNLNDAFELGVVEIDLANLGEENTPQLICRTGINPKSIHLISDS